MGFMPCDVKTHMLLDVKSKACCYSEPSILMNVILET